MGNNFKYIVYQTINTVNNKIYVGVHKINSTSFDGYIGNGVNINYPSTYMNPKYPFLYAVKKYGTSSFKRTTLFMFDDEDKAYAKEREIVNLEFVLRSDTYNCILGGSLRPLFYERLKIYQFDLTGKLVKEWNDIYECSKFLETWKLSIYSAINNKTRLYNYYWSYYKEIDILEYTNPNLSLKVYKYDKTGKCICIYDSINKAALANDYKPCELYNRIKELALTKNNYYSFTLYDEFIPSPRLELKNKTLYLYDLDGNFIKEISYSDFKKELKLSSNKKISTSIKTCTPINGFLIKLYKLDKIEKYNPKNKSKKVIVYKLDGSFVNEYESINKMCKELDLDTSTVNKVLRGAYKSTKGYTIKIKDIV